MFRLFETLSLSNDLSLMIAAGVICHPNVTYLNNLMEDGQLRPVPSYEALAEENNLPFLEDV